MGVKREKLNADGSPKSVKLREGLITAACADAPNHSHPVSRNDRIARLQLLMWFSPCTTSLVAIV
jgi:hypothetical protein